MAKNALPQKAVDLSKWYLAVIEQAKLADYAPVKGCMVFRPQAYAIWENLTKAINHEFALLGIENAYFPLFIPHSFLQKEAEHVEGFSPELAIVTHAGGKKLPENLVVRPTSETIIYQMYAKWISSWRDLPIKLNQWCSVVRWEKRTHFFLRTSEFLWSECHCAHANHDESLQMVFAALKIYQKILQEVLAIPVIPGFKSESEKFAGSCQTTTIEALMPDGKALQAGTSHDLGQNFSQKKAFNISYQDKNGHNQYVWQNCFGITTRTLGALIMTHGDDDGLVLPPLVAHTQVEIVLPLPDELVHDFAAKLIANLNQHSIRARLNDDYSNSFGYRLNEAELKGVPIIIVVGKKELQSQVLTLKLRHNHASLQVKASELATSLPPIFAQIQQQMLIKAQTFVTQQTRAARDYQQFKDIMRKHRGLIKAYWCENSACEAAIKQETKATTRCLPLKNFHGEVTEGEGKCIYCGKKTHHQWIFAQAY